MSLKKNAISLSIFACVGFSLLLALSLVFGEPGLLFGCSVRASHCSGFSCCGAWALACKGFSSCGSRALERRLNSLGAQA